MTSFDMLRALAGVAGTAGSVRAALMEWASVCPGPTIRQVSARARMGAPLASVLAPLSASPDGRLTVRAIEGHALHGGSLAATLSALADAQELRLRSAHEARMASSASKLSGRLLAGLAVTGILLMPGGRSSLATTIGSLMAALVLGAIGIAWVRRLTPRPPSTDPPAAAIAELTAGLIDGGLYPATALDLACPEDLPARRLVKLGMGWPAALDREETEDLRAMARILMVTSASGSTSGSLRLLARDLREKQRRECDKAIHRAPVLLVLPLTLCFLPAFALVLVGPMIRGLSG